MTTVLLIHGGLWEDDMDATRFWRDPGITAGLRGRGLKVLGPSRLLRPPNWQAEVSHLVQVLPGRPVTVLAGSNGCTVAARLALARPAAIARLILAWPATAGDPAVDARDRSRLARLGASPEIIRALLAGHTLRGVTDAELASLTMPAGVLPSAPANPVHQRRTADAMLDLLPAARELPGSPEPPRPEFPPHLEPVCSAITAFALL